MSAQRNLDIESVCLIDLDSCKAQATDLRADIKALEAQTEGLDRSDAKAAANNLTQVKKLYYTNLEVQALAAQVELEDRGEGWWLASMSGEELRDRGYLSADEAADLNKMRRESFAAGFIGPGFVADSKTGRLVLINKIKAAVDAAKGIVNFPVGISFNPNIKYHLSNFDGLAQKKGVGGAHNKDIFDQVVSQNGLKVIGETSSSVDGIKAVSYKIPAYDSAGNVIGYKNQVFDKTIYDPKIFTDKKMLELGQMAASSGYKDALSQGLGQYDATAGGVNFRVYLDKVTGAVTNFHPK